MPLFNEVNVKMLILYKKITETEIVCTYVALMLKMKVYNTNKASFSEMYIL